MIFVQMSKNHDFIAFEHILQSQITTLSNIARTTMSHNFRTNVQKS